MCLTKSKILSFAIALTLTLGCSVVFMQVPQNSTKFRMLAKFYKGDVIEALNNVSATIEGVATEHEGNFVVVICSSRPLKDAIATSSGKPYLLLQILPNYHFSVDKLFFATRSNCTDSVESIPPAVEFWYVQDLSKFESDNILKATDIKIIEYQYPENHKQFLNNLSKFRNDLKNNPNLQGYILGYYLNSPSSQLRKNIKMSNSYLNKSRVGKMEIKAFIQFWSGIEDDALNLDYPFFLAIDVKNPNTK